MSLCDLMFGSHDEMVDPVTVYWSLRYMFAVASWVLNDLAVERLTPAIKSERLKSLFFLATSYVSWTYQSHTFSNSVETILVLWCLVIIVEIDKATLIGKSFDCALLGAMIVFGVFNRITFPAFLLVPMTSLIPHFYKYPSAFLSFILSGIAVFCLGVYIDTTLYGANIGGSPPLSLPYVITPLNNILYNSDPAKLALHGLHSPLQHWFVNLPQLIGPAFLLLMSKKHWKNIAFQSAVSAIVILSFIPHAEPRFLLPAVPLFSVCFDIDVISRRGHQISVIFLAAWLIFNMAMGILMGTFHQGGIVPAQIEFSENLTFAENVIWWKTYSPPIWILGKPHGSVNVISPDPNTNDDNLRFAPIYQNYVHSPDKDELMTIVDLMGAPELVVRDVLAMSPLSTYFVAPVSSVKKSPLLTQFVRDGYLTQVWFTRIHLSLDDIDWSDLGSSSPGLAIWKLDKPPPIDS